MTAFNKDTLSPKNNAARYCLALTSKQPKRAPFTSEDDNLQQFIAEKSASEIEIENTYKEFAETHRHHSMKSWKSRAVAVLKLTTVEPQVPEKFFTAHLKPKKPKIPGRPKNVKYGSQSRAHTTWMPAMVTATSPVLSTGEAGSSTYSLPPTATALSSGARDSGIHDITPDMAQFAEELEDWETTTLSTLDGNRHQSDNDVGDVSNSSASIANQVLLGHQGPVPRASTLDWRGYDEDDEPLIRRRPFLVEAPTSTAPTPSTSLQPPQIEPELQPTSTATTFNSYPVEVIEISDDEDLAIEETSQQHQQHQDGAREEGAQASLTQDQLIEYLRLLYADHIQKLCENEGLKSIQAINILDACSGKFNRAVRLIRKLKKAKIQTQYSKIWTSMDDSILYFQNESQLEELKSRHSLREIVKRANYLAHTRQGARYNNTLTSPTLPASLMRLVPSSQPVSRSTNDYGVQFPLKQLFHLKAKALVKIHRSKRRRVNDDGL